MCVCTFDRIQLFISKLKGFIRILIYGHADDLFLLYFHNLPTSRCLDNIYYSFFTYIIVSFLLDSSCDIIVM